LAGGGHRSAPAISLTIPTAKNVLVATGLVTIIKNYLGRNKMLKDHVDVENDYYFFWGGLCSQWAESPFTEFGIEFNCAEQFMMAAKAKVFEDDDSYHAIMATPMPNDQKALGKKVKGFVLETWNEVAKDYVTLGNINKFEQNKEFYDFLHDNKSRYFVEASPYDKIWGIGMRENDLLINNPKHWKGLNWLGECINDAAIMIFENGQEADVNELRERLNWFK